MPEEINRVLTDHLAELLFAPTETAVENLLREGIAAEKIHLVGDVMYDAALYYGAIAEKKSSILNKLGLKPREYILATVHRAENTDDPARLEAIFGGMSKVAKEIPVVMPLHPRTRAALERDGLYDIANKCLKLIPPVDYLDMIMLEKNARLIATDSGGVQKEAYFYRVPCITLREETEWVELVEAGWNILLEPFDFEVIAATVMTHLNYQGNRSYDLYGRGEASVKILKRMIEPLKR